MAHLRIFRAASLRSMGSLGGKGAHDVRVRGIRVGEKLEGTGVGSTDKGK